MSLFIEKLELVRYRNYQHLILNELKPLVIIVGENAIGKTNIIEALQLVTSLTSFRNPGWEELVYIENEGVEKGDEIRAFPNTKIIFEATGNQRKSEIQMEVCDNNRQYFLNGKKTNRKDILGLFPSVLFTPDDLAIIKGASGTRREFIDDIGSQLSPTFERIRQEYATVIKQKNRLLKSGEVNNLVLESWSFNQAKLGAVLYLHRRQLLKKVAAETKKIVNKIAPGEDFQVYYLPSWEKEKAETEIKCFLVEESKDETREEIQEKLFEKLLQVSKEECACGYSLLGPHRDEIIINVNNKNSRKFSSQGQQRTIALALKRAAMLIIRETSGRQPIFLLDDAMSELDERRRELLMATINEAQQTFITTTTLNYFTSETIKKAQIIKLPAGAAIK